MTDHDKLSQASRPLPQGVSAPILFVTVALVFLPSLRNGFVDWDDHVTILSNPHFRGLGWAELRWMFTTFLLGPYQPLSWMSLGADYVVWGLNPAGYHLTSLLLHAANAGLLFLVTLRILSAAMPQVAAGTPRAIALGATFTSLAFALHPLRVESVVWATERRDVLSGFFLLLSLAAYLAGLGAGGASSDSRRFPLVSLALFALALLAKASVIAFPLVLLLVDAYPLARLPRDPRAWRAAAHRRVLLEKAPFFVLAAIIALVAIYGQATARAVRTLEESGLVERVAYATYAAGFYVWKTLAPFRLSPLYEAPSDLGPIGARIIASAAFLVIVSVAAAKAWDRAPGVLVAWLSYLAFLAPVSGLLHVGTQIAADRYTYLPVIALTMLLGAAFARVFARGGRAALGAGVLGPILLAALALLTGRQIAVWRDSLTLWRHAVRLAPSSSIAQYGLGGALSARGQKEEAIVAYREAVRINPGYADARNNLGTLLAERGDLLEAREQFLAIEAIYPKDAMLQYNLGLVAGMMGHRDEAADRYEFALARQPRLSSARVNLALLLEENGRAEEARGLLLEGLALAPGDTLITRALGRLERERR